MGRAEMAAFHELVMNPREKTAMTGAVGDSESFGDGLAAAARSIIADGRRALADPELSDAKAVHDVRKALARLAAPARPPARRAGRPNARRGARSDAGAGGCPRRPIDARCAGRPAQGRPAVFPDVDGNDQPEADRHQERRRADRLHQGDARDRLSRYLDYATLSLERWPLAAINFDTVADGLIATYRRGRQLLPDTWAEADAEHLHDLRRRVVEHGHQMGLIEPLWPRLGKLWAEEAQRLRNRLGACVHRPDRPASAAGAVAVAACAGGRGAARGAFEDGGAAGWKAIRGKAEGVPPPHRGAVERAAGEEKLARISECKSRRRFPGRRLVISRGQLRKQNGRHCGRPFVLIPIIVMRIFVLGRTGSDLLFQVLRLSTIGAGEFYGRVRDGIGYRPPAKTTRPAKDV
jgi:hypothetical protein